MSTIDHVVKSDDVMVAGLLSGATYESAARLAGCSKSTVTRRMSDPAFRLHLDRLRRSVITRPTDLLAAQTLESIAVLAERRDDATLPGATPAEAARDLLDLAARYHDAADVAARIEAIEQTLSRRRRS